MKHKRRKILIGIITGLLLIAQTVPVLADTTTEVTNTSVDAQVSFNVNVSVDTTNNPMFETYTVVFNTTTQRTVANPPTVSNQTVYSNGYITQPSSANVSGYETTWYLDSNFSVPFTFTNGKSASTINSYSSYIGTNRTLTLYANYRQSSYYVYFEPNGGTAVAAQTFTYSTAKIAKPYDPGRTGYTLEGWFLDSGLQTPLEFDASGMSKKTVGELSAYFDATRTMRVYAKWKAKQEEKKEEKSSSSTTTNQPWTLADIYKYITGQATAESITNKNGTGTTTGKTTTPITNSNNNRNSSTSNSNNNNNKNSGSTTEENKDTIKNETTADRLFTPASGKYYNWADRLDWTNYDSKVLDKLGIQKGENEKKQLINALQQEAKENKYAAARDVATIAVDMVQSYKKDFMLPILVIAAIATGVLGVAYFLIKKKGKRKA